MTDGLQGFSPVCRGSVAEERHSGTGMLYEQTTGLLGPEAGTPGAVLDLSCVPCVWAGGASLSL